MKTLVFKEDIVLCFYFYDGNTLDYDSIVLGRRKQAGRGQPGSAEQTRQQWRWRKKISCLAARETRCTEGTRLFGGHTGQLGTAGIQNLEPLSVALSQNREVFGFGHRCRQHIPLGDAQSLAVVSCSPLWDSPGSFALAGARSSREQGALPTHAFGKQERLQYFIGADFPDKKIRVAKQRCRWKLISNISRASAHLRHSCLAGIVSL